MLYFPYISSRRSLLDLLVVNIVVYSEWSGPLIANGTTSFRAIPCCWICWKKIWMMWVHRNSIIINSASLSEWSEIKLKWIRRRTIRFHSCRLLQLFKLWTRLWTLHLTLCLRQAIQTQLNKTNFLRIHSRRCRRHTFHTRRIHLKGLRWVMWTISRARWLLPTLLASCLRAWYRPVSCRDQIEVSNFVGFMLSRYLEYHSHVIRPSSQSPEIAFHRKSWLSNNGYAAVWIGKSIWMLSANFSHFMWCFSIVLGINIYLLHIPMRQFISLMDAKHSLRILLFTSRPAQGPCPGMYRKKDRSVIFKYGLSGHPQKLMVPLMAILYIIYWKIRSESCKTA